MRTVIRAALVATLALAAAAGGLRAQDAGTPDGTPDIGGVWEGKVKGKRFGMSTDAVAGGFRAPVSLEVEQDGATLTAVYRSGGDDPQEYFLSGIVGNGEFWLRGDTTGFGTPVVLSGHVKGKAGKLKIKAAGIAAFLDGAADLKVAAKYTGPIPE